MTEAQPIVSGSGRYWPQLTANVFSWLILLGGIATFCFTAYCTVLSYSPVPWMDLWFLFRILDQDHLSFWQLMWHQTNEHRLLFPKIFILMDLFWFGGKSIFLLILVFLVQMLNCAVLGMCFWRSRRFTPLELRSAAGVILFCLFSPAKREDFIFGWQFVFILLVTMLTSSIAALALASSVHKARHLWLWTAAAWGAGVVASFSVLTGFLIWPVLLVEGLMLRLPRKILLLTAFIGATAAALYTIGFERGSHANLSDTAAHLPKVFTFFNYILTESWSPLSVDLGTAVAWIGIFACLLLVLERLFSGFDGRRLEIVLVMLASVSASAAALIAAGRWNVGFSNRYEEPASLFWVAVGLLFLALACRYRFLAGLLAWQTLLLCLMVSGTTKRKELTSEAISHRQALNLAGAALATGVSDQSALQFIVAPADFALADMDYLKRNNIAMYPGPPESLLGENLPQRFKISDRPCPGRLLSINSVDDPRWPGLTFRGSGPLTRKWVLIADSSGLIVGLGAEDHRPISPPAVADAAHTWTAFAPASARRKALRFYRLLPPDSVCQIVEASAE